MRKVLCLVLAMLLLTGAALAEKSEVVYAVLDADGSVDGAYVVNEFSAGRIVDYGDYSGVRMLNTLDEIEYRGDRVTFRTTAERAAYQGDLADAELPWLFDIEYMLDGRVLPARRVAGEDGTVAVRLKITKNPDCAGDFFNTHALQITVQLDMDRCTDITANGATQARVGDMRQLTYILLPGTESEITFACQAEDFYLPAISINGVMMSLDLGDNAMVGQLTEGGVQLREGADMMVDALFAQANAELKAKEADLKKLKITVPVLTRDNYVQELDKVMAAFLDGLDAYVMNQASATLETTVRNAVRAEVRKQVEQAARPTVRAEVEKAVEAEVRRQVEAAMENPSGDMVEQQVQQQMQSAAVQAVIDGKVFLAMQSGDTQDQITAEMAAVIRPQVEATLREQTRTEAANAAQLTITAQVQLELRTQGINPDDATVAAMVAERMQSAETQQGIESATQLAMESDVMQALIDAAVLEQCRGDAGYDQAYAEAEAAVRAQVTAEVEADVRKAVIASIKLLGSGSVDEVVAEQMQSEAVQATIEAETDKAMQSGEAKAQIDAMVEQQMQSAEVKAIIQEEIVKGRYSSAYQSSVAEALKKNGKDGEAYQALVTLKASLDDVMAFRDGLYQYTNGVEGALGGLGSMGVGTLTSFTDSRNEDVTSVQFAITTRAVEKEAEVEKVTEAEEPTIIDRFLDLFR
ncbi:MAG: hypothetical protein IJ438_11050 [Clostridia bacterium]|nr:hypothetical protein [Clostridia bacterium]